jgi:RNA polymerase sigma-70 factor, ECF subfamily
MQRESGGATSKKVVRRNHFAGGHTNLSGMGGVAEMPAIGNRLAESDLVGRFIAGDAEAFTRIVTLYSPRVAALAYRLMGYRGEVDDLVQDVFLAALEQRKRFRAESGLWTWLTSITLNRCRANQRRQRVRNAAARLIGRPRTDAPADVSAIIDESAARVRRAVAELSDRDREVIVLHYFEHLPIAELCELLGERQSAVTVRLHRAREKLRHVLNEHTDA